MAAPYYEDEDVALYNGDCLHLAAIWTVADVMLTDPPYGRAWRQGSFKDKVDNAISKVGIANDENTDARDEMLAIWGEDKPAILFGDLMLPPPGGTKLVAVYQKPGDAGFRGAIGGVRRDAEAIYLNSAFKGGLGGRSSIFATRQPQVAGANGIVALSGGHPHSKPTDVLVDLLRLLPEGVVADPFAGGGINFGSRKARRA